MNEWILHYPSWMIGDGEPDWAVGDEFDWFVVEFWSEAPLVIGTEKAKSASQANDYSYRVSAEVVHLFPTQKTVVLDFGLLVVGNTDDLPPNVAVGDFVIGEISLGLPLAIDVIPHEVILQLGRRWRVNRILADLTPYAGSRRDTTRIAYQEVTSTLSIEAVDYLLFCTELGSPAVPYPAS